MKSLFPFKFFRPIFCSGLLEDPLLIIRQKSKLNNNILVDCGQLNHLAKRVLKSIKALFISHTHMDHFIGFDSFTRSVLVSNKTIDIFGPAGIAKQVENRLKGYSWNLTEAYYCKFRIHEIHPDKIKIFNMDGDQGFMLIPEDEHLPQSRLIFEDTTMVVEAAVCDHKIPVLIFKFTEKPGFEVNEKKISELGLKNGTWLNQLKTWYKQPYDERKALEIEVKTLDSPSLKILDSQTLYDSIKKESDTNSIGYITDVGFTSTNLQTISDLMEDVTLLVCECTYLSENKEKARVSYHLCTEDINHLLRTLKPQFFLPMHLSKTYLSRSEEFYQELSIPDNCQLITKPERITHPPMVPKEIDLNNS